MSEPFSPLKQCDLRYVSIFERIKKAGIVMVILDIATVFTMPVMLVMPVMLARRATLSSGMACGVGPRSHLPLGLLHPRDDLGPQFSSVNTRRGLQGLVTRRVTR